MLKNRKILIPDTGPFITLEMINRLDLLLYPNMQVYVIDAVFEEVVFDKNHPNSKAFLDFLVNNKSPLIHNCTTNVGEAMNMLDWKKLPRQNRKALFEHAGENAIREWIIKNKDNISDYIIITEDGRARNKFDFEFKDLPLSQKPIIVNTVYFLRFLEKKELIPSADDIIEEIKDVNNPKYKARNIF